jgi:hypothetical protein
VMRGPWLIYDIARKPLELHYDSTWDTIPRVTP